ncbi:MAG: PDZ domain-containing protein, partial [Candidatus Coatesbacteria bacterium]|nr:PDZ domain-containing protein [Candidatus Coatesbacteria bacterium]
MKSICAVAVLLTFVMAIGLWGCAGKHHEESQAMELPKKSIERYIEVSSVAEGTQAEAIGIQAGDILLKYDGKELGTISDLHEAIKAATGDDVIIVVKRDGNPISLSAKPGKIGVMLKTVAEVHRMPDAKIIEGIDPLSWESEETISYIACVRRVLAHYGEQYEYMYLMGISGAAFRLHFFGGWCSSSPDPTCGFDCSKAVYEALGRKTEHHFMNHDNFEMPDALTEPEMRQKITEAIDRDIPVIAIDIVQIPEWGIITGYQNDKQDLFCRSYFDPEMEDYNVVEKMPWVTVMIGEKGEALSGEEAVKQSLAIAQYLGRAEKFDQYYSGIAGFEQWIASLEEMSAPMEAAAPRSMDDIMNAMQANAWIYE